MSWDVIADGAEIRAADINKFARSFNGEASQGIPLAQTSVTGSQAAISAKNTTGPTVLFYHRNGNAAIAVDQNTVYASADGSDCVVGALKVLSSATGKVGRTMLDGPDTYHAAEYGVVFDLNRDTGLHTNGLGGPATDNTAAMQALINLVAAAGGGTILLPPGAARLADALTWAKNVHLRGSGRGLSWLCWDDLSDAEYNAGVKSRNCFNVLGAWRAEASADALVAATALAGSYVVTLSSATNRARYDITAAGNYGRPIPIEIFGGSSSDGYGLTWQGVNYGRFITYSKGISTGDNINWNVLLADPLPWTIAAGDTPKIRDRTSTAADTIRFADFSVDIVPPDSSVASAKNRMVAFNVVAGIDIEWKSVGIRRMWYKGIDAYDCRHLRILSCKAESIYGTHPSTAGSGPFTFIGCTDVRLVEPLVEMCSWGVDFTCSYDCYVLAPAILGRPIYYSSSSQDHWRGRGITFERSCKGGGVFGGIVNGSMLTGLIAVDSQGIVFDGVTIQGTGQKSGGAGGNSGYPGIMMNDYITGNTKGNVISNCILRDCTSWGISLEYSAQPGNPYTVAATADGQFPVRVVGNDISGCHGGISTLNRGVSIINNAIRGCTGTGAIAIGAAASANSGDTITPAGGSYCFVANNLIDNAGKHTIHTTKGTGFNVIGPNYIIAGLAPELHASDWAAASQGPTVFGLMNNAGSSQPTLVLPPSGPASVAYEGLVYISSVDNKLKWYSGGALRSTP